MNYNEIALKSCYFDKRNPNGFYSRSGDTYEVEPMHPSCSCNNCWDGVSEYAAITLDALDALEKLTELHESLLDGECCDHEVGMCYCEDFDAISQSKKLLVVK